MSIVVWDGKQLAIDSLSVMNGRRRMVDKFRVSANGSVMTWVGDHELGLVMAEWRARGMTDEFPTRREDEDYTKLIMMTSVGNLFQWHTRPVADQISKGPFAWGDGAPYALGAISMGADAAKAAIVACVWSIYCGGSIHVFNPGGEHKII